MTSFSSSPAKYSALMRSVHWLRALVVLGTLAVGITMVNLPDDLQMKFESLYPNHKQFGLLAWVLTWVQLVARRTSPMPLLPAALAPWEKTLSKLTHGALYVLLLLVPLMGYCMSSTFSMSDGVPFFFISHVPELLPKNDAWFEQFQLAHKVLAYVLLGLIALHIAGALKHRFFDRHGDADVLKHML